MIKCIHNLDPDLCSSCAAAEAIFGHKLVKVTRPYKKRLRRLVADRKSGKIWIVNRADRKGYYYLNTVPPARPDLRHVPYSKLIKEYVEA